MPTTTSRPRVVHCREEKYDMLCDRTTKFGNPFIMGRDGDRRTVVKRHKRWLLGLGDKNVRWMGFSGPEILDMVHELTDAVLGCHCAPHSCHCDFLLERANRMRSW